MKIFSLLIISLMVSAMSFSQPAWTIYYNNQVKLKTKTEDETKNVVAISKAELNQKGNLVVSYTRTADDADWKRTVVIGDSSLEGEADKKNPKIISFTITNAMLKQSLSKENKIMIYTVSVPSDPSQAAAVRVRRIHLCTVWLK